MISDLPSPFVVEWLPRVTARSSPRTRALDVAMGRGRHAHLLAAAGCVTFGVDVKLHAVRDATARARADELVVHGWCADLTVSSLPRNAFDLILVTRYLQRDLFPAIIDALADGGVVLYETFTIDQRAHGRGPTSPDHLLRHGELARHFETLDILFEEAVDVPEAVARIVAQKRSPTRR
jgi:SAM-dependent methyltransferase